MKYYKTVYKIWFLITEIWKRFNSHWQQSALMISCWSWSHPGWMSNLDNHNNFLIMFRSYNQYRLTIFSSQPPTHYKSYIILNLFLNIYKKSFSNFILHNIQLYDSHRKTTLLSDLKRHEKTLVINQSHIKYGSLCFYTILIFLLFQNRIIISPLQQLMMQQMEKVHILIKLCAVQKQSVS
jgi:hypothetical protein